MSDGYTNHAIVTALWDTWGKNPPAVPSDGNRLFERHVDADLDEPSWNDWQLIGLVGADGSIEWLEGNGSDTLGAKYIQESINNGLRFGRLLICGFGVEWGLFRGDGPTEARVSDWATPNSESPKP